MDKTIKLLILSDIFVVTGFGLIDPILAIFIKDGLAGGSLFAAGLAVMLFLITKSAFQLPFSRYVDSHVHKVVFLVIGTFIIALVPFLYVFTTNVNTIYLAQVLRGIGAGLAVPTWLSLFSTHLDRKHEGFEWAAYSTSVGLGAAVTGALGAAVAQSFGFQITFAATGILSIVGTLILLKLERHEHFMEKVFGIHHKGKLVKFH